MGLYCALYVIVSPLRIPKTTSLKKSFNFSSRCFRYTTIFWGHCPMDGHLDHFQNFRNKNKDAKKTIELRPLGLVCVFLWDRYYKRDGWVQALLWYTAKLALENTWSICSTEMKVGWNRALNFWCLPFFDIALFPVFPLPRPSHLHLHSSWWLLLPSTSICPGLLTRCSSLPLKYQVTGLSCICQKWIESTYSHVDG